MAAKRLAFTGFFLAIIIITIFFLVGGVENKDFCWNCMYRLGKTFAAIVSNGFTANSLLYPCNTKTVIVNFLFSGGGEGGLKIKTFAGIVCTD